MNETFALKGLTAGPQLSRVTRYSDSGLKQAVYLKGFQTKGGNVVRKTQPENPNGKPSLEQVRRRPKTRSSARRDRHESFYQSEIDPVGEKRYVQARGSPTQSETDMRSKRGSRHSKASTSLAPSHASQNHIPSKFIPPNQMPARNMEPATFTSKHFPPYNMPRYDEPANLVPPIHAPPNLSQARKDRDIHYHRGRSSSRSGTSGKSSLSEISEEPEEIARRGRTTSRREHPEAYPPLPCDTDEMKPRLSKEARIYSWRSKISPAEHSTPELPTDSQLPPQLRNHRRKTPSSIIIKNIALSSGTGYDTDALSQISRSTYASSKMSSGKSTSRSSRRSHRMGVSSGSSAISASTYASQSSGGGSYTSDNTSRSSRTRLSSRSSRSSRSRTSGYDASIESDYESDNSTLYGVPKV
ncbi:hypothetical protein DM02DRAFT_656029 [Periconia macrospinosa]|uniref:Uncharacterized protein n=1 Tax=Periconia macrospinosa TaxID=97972 RepID=A0A2V1DRN9_9PLEO|nr:hypothetical protein DM02DRAFT_656029 [Periconia macrospinosa]